MKSASFASKRRPVRFLDTGNTVASVDVAAGILGVSAHRVVKSIRSSMRCKGHRLDYASSDAAVDADEQILRIVPTSNARRVRNYRTGEIYPSLSAAARGLGTHIPTIARVCNGEIVLSKYPVEWFDPAPRQSAGAARAARRDRPQPAPANVWAFLLSAEDEQLLKELPADAENLSRRMCRRRGFDPRDVAQLALIHLARYMTNRPGDVLDKDSPRRFALAVMRRAILRILMTPSLYDSNTRNAARAGRAFAVRAFSQCGDGDPDEGSTTPSSGPGPADRIEREETWDRLLAGVGPADREILEMRYQAGWLDQEIADRLGVSLSVVETRLREAYEAIRVTFRGDEHSPAGPAGPVWASCGSFDGRPTGGEA